MKKQIDIAVALLQKLHLEGVSAREIACDLNAAGFLTHYGKCFTRANILNILSRQSQGKAGRYAVAFNRAEGITCQAQ